MRVCLVSGTLPEIFCGVGEYTARLAEALAREGLHVEILTSQDPAICPHEMGPNVKVHAEVEGWGFVDLFGIARRARALVADVIHIQYPTIAYARHPAITLLPLLLLWSGIPVVVTVHEFRHAHLLRRLSTTPFLLAADALIVPTREEEAAVLRWVPWLRGRIHVIPVGATLVPSGENVEADRGERCSPFQVAYLGMLYRGKGLETLILSLAGHQAEWEGVELVIIGDQHPFFPGYGERLRRMADQAGVSERIRWMGRCSREEASQCLFQSQACILPFEDGASLRRTSLVSALAHGVPVITTSGLRPPDDLRDREEVILVPPRDPAALARAVAALRDSPTLRETLRRGARKLAATLSWSSIAARNRAVYQRAATN